MRISILLLSKHELENACLTVNTPPKEKTSTLGDVAELFECRLLYSLLEAEFIGRTVNKNIEIEVWFCSICLSCTVTGLYDLAYLVRAAQNRHKSWDADLTFNKDAMPAQSTVIWDVEIFS